MTVWTAQNSEGYDAPIGLAADVVVLTVRDGLVQALCLTRDDKTRVVPGGFVIPGETAEQAAARALRDKTGVDGVWLEQLGAFTDPGRDSRGWVPAIAFIALLPASVEPTDPSASWVPVDDISDMGFDHRLMLDAAIDRVRGKLWWSNIAVGVLPDTFTLPQARVVYEAFAGRSYQPGTFRRDLLATGLIEATGEKIVPPGGGRPADVYRFATAQQRWGAGRSKRVS